MSNSADSRPQADSAVPQQPIAPGAPMPHRKVIRGWLTPLVERQVAIAVVLLVLDWAIFASLIAGTVLVSKCSGVGNREIGQGGRRSIAACVI